ncbi:hypothetical protein CC78DRAFT_537838 [Lojkania enalia]|uniref:Non-canonical purine NTP phosphatase/PRRC1 domain-containing protein n=1 Tax=Lojkania enalia TaxID=147567 RepID=A0A9P4JXL4_9PLEO|nr:hypothetical protein CC78DRAFT_537838 [Didymosphaeria enalia]
MEHHMSAAANVINYSKELVLAMGSTLVRNIAEIAGTERVVPPITKTLPTQPFSLFQYSVSGNSVVVIIPTENEFKIQLLEGTFRNQNVSVRTITVPVESGVGEQPYNDAGVVGAYNRINNALKRLNTEEYREILLKNGAGTVFVASVENFIQTTNIERPTDYGIIVIHNATNNKTTLGISCGVTVPPEYVSRARHFGFGEELDHGRVTVGQILAANVAGLDKRDWHKVLARKSRYELLRETTGLLPIPW